MFNNPINFNDPDGKIVLALPFIFGGGGAAAFDFALGFALGTATINAAQNALQSLSDSGGVPSTFERSRGRGKQRKTGDDLKDLSDEDLFDRARDRSKSKAERKRAREEEKARQKTRKSRQSKDKCK